MDDYRVYIFARPARVRLRRVFVGGGAPEGARGARGEGAPSPRAGPGCLCRSSGATWAPAAVGEGRGGTASGAASRSRARRSRCSRARRSRWCSRRCRSWTTTPCRRGRRAPSARTRGQRRRRTRTRAWPDGRGRASRHGCVAEVSRAITSATTFARCCQSFPTCPPLPTAPHHPARAPGAAHPKRSHRQESPRAALDVRRALTGADRA